MFLWWTCWLAIMANDFNNWSSSIRVSGNHAAPRTSEIQSQHLVPGPAQWPLQRVALIAGVSASDWSWCPIFMDVDLDGDSDLLISNGFSFDVMDQDSHDRLKTMSLTMQQRNGLDSITHPSRLLMLPLGIVVTTLRVRSCLLGFWYHWHLLRNGSWGSR